MRSVSVGPYGFAELGVGVAIRAALSAFLAAGPVVTRTVVGGAALWRAGGAARLGVAYDF